MNKSILTTAAFLSLGILIQEKIHAPIYIPIGLIALTVALLLLHPSRGVSTLLFSLLFLLLGMTTLGIKERIYTQKEKSLKPLQRNKPTHITGEVISTSKNKFILNLKTLSQNNFTWKKNTPVKILIFCQKKPNISPSDVVTFWAIPLKISPPLNPLQFNYKQHLKRKDLCASFLCISPINKIKTKGGIIHLSSLIRKKMIKNLQSFNKEDVSHFLLGTMFGKKEYIPPPILNKFKKTSTMHLLAVSGLHVGIVLGFIWWVLSLFKINENIKALLCIPFLILYAILTGLSPSSIRATIMAIVFLTTYKRYNPLNSLGISAILMLTYNPYYLFTASFQMSFAAVLGILLLYPKARKLFPSPQKIKKWLYTFNIPYKNYLSLAIEGIISSIIISGCAYIFISPIVAYYFNQISLVGIFTNILSAPLMFIILPLGMVSSILGNNVVGYIPFGIAYILTKLLLQWIHLWSALPFSSIPCQSPSILFFILYYTFWMLVILDSKPTTYALFLLITSFLIINTSNKIAQNHRLVIFKLPKGYASLIEEKKRGYLFIWECKNKKAEKIITSYIKKRGFIKVYIFCLKGDANFLKENNNIKIYNAKQGEGLKGKLRFYSKNKKGIFALYKNNTDVYFLNPSTNWNNLLKNNKRKILVFIGGKNKTPPPCSKVTYIYTANMKKAKIFDFTNGEEIPWN